MKATDKQHEPTNRISRFIVAIGLVLLGSAVVIPAVASNVGDWQPALRALDQEYEERAAALPEGPKQTALDLEYEKAREQLLTEFGLVAPNGADPSPNPEEQERNLPPDGIHEANEDPEGYALTNFWVHEFEDGDYIYVGGASIEGDPTVGGVVVMDVSGQDFYPAPDKVGALTIKSVEGSSLTLVSKDGAVFAFDYVTREFSSA